MRFPSWPFYSSDESGYEEAVEDYKNLPAGHFEHSRVGASDWRFWILLDKRFPNVLKSKKGKTGE